MLPPLRRREFLNSAGCGLGALACLDLLLRDGVLGGPPRPVAVTGGLHFQGRARRVIQLVMNGGVSQMDTFDYKPALEKFHGQQVDFGLKASATGVPGPVMRSPFPFRQCGESGRWVSSMFSHTAAHVDDLAFLMAMTSKTNVHGPASYLQNTGFVAPGFPCLGAWIGYALGRLTDNLPTFVVLPDPRGLPYNNRGNFGAGFLSASHAGAILRPHLPVPIPNLAPPLAPDVTPASEAEGELLLRQLNADHLAEHLGDSRLEARMHAFELAARMQLAAPQALNLDEETAATHQLFGLDDPHTAPFGKNCLVARRLVERGVRFVQVWSGAGGASKNWDNHTNVPEELPYIASSVDRPIAGLLADLKQRGLLEDTLVIWTTEFGRMPFTQNQTGRDHNGGTFVTWLAGAGIRGGTSVGESDEFSYRAVQDVTWGYDLHATILHLLGIDHTRLTVRHNGIDRRITDVHGTVIDGILA